MAKVQKEWLQFANNENSYFQFYEARVTRLEPLGFITVIDFLRLQQDDSQKHIFHRIATAEASGNKTLKSNLKQTYLKKFAPCVIIGDYIPGIKEYEPADKWKENCQWKDYAHIDHYTGWVILDFDHLPNPEKSEQFKQFIFQKYDCIVAAWLSPSKHGVKALVSIPIVNTVDEFKEYYWGLYDELKQFGHIHGKPWIDDSGQNPTLSLFQSYDPDLIVADEFTTWTTKGEKPNAFEYSSKATPPPNVNPTEKDKQTVIKSINTMFQNINEGTGGHPNVIAKCITVGGWVASGYIDEHEALQHIDWNIENHHYLSKGIEGYKKDARFAINEGTKKPLEL